MTDAVRPYTNDEQLDCLARLLDGWDSYGAPAIDARAIAAVRRFLRYRWAIVPSNDGGIQLEWHGGDVDIELEFGPDGRPMHLFAERASDDVSLTVDEGDNGRTE